MQLIVFTGLQASGKTTFYLRHFLPTHLRLSLDQLNGSRHREWLLFQAAVDSKTLTVIDNTNPTAAERARYVVPAKEAKYEVVSYYFQSTLEDCLARNATRAGPQRIPDPGVRGCYRRLEVPAWYEGFDAMCRVRIGPGGEFVIEAMEKSPA
jgi:predicted kinase